MNAIVKPATDLAQKTAKAQRVKSIKLKIKFKSDAGKD